MQQIRVGVVGAGWPAWQHMRGYQALEGVEVAALCDINESQLKTIADEYGIEERYTDFEQMLSKGNLDCVSVCTPNRTHAELSIAAMKSGLHVLCEKPLASTSLLAQQIIEARNETGMVFLLGHQKRYTPEVRYLKGLIDRGELGEIYFARCTWVRRSGIPGLGGWFTTRELSGGGALIDIGVHVLDLGLWFMGFPEPTGVSASWGSHFGVHGTGTLDYAGGPRKDGTFDVDDFAVSHVRFGGGRSLVLQTSWASHVRDEQLYLEVWGTRGGARTDPLEIFTTKEGEPVDLKPELGEEDSFLNETSHFIECIRGNQSPMCTAEQGRKTLGIIEQIYAEGETNLRG